MALYTVVLEFDGGTYVSQVNARLAQHALAKWADCLDHEEVKGLGDDGKNALRDELAADARVGQDLVPVKGAKNVWSATALVRGKFALMNVVRTAN